MGSGLGPTLLHVSCVRLGLPMLWRVQVYIGGSGGRHLPGSI